MRLERPARFPKRERLRGKSAFRRIYEEGQAFRGRTMVMIVRRGPDLERRVGFVSSRKVGGAVKRNRARRLMRECYRRLRSELVDSDRSIQIAFIARRELPGTTIDVVFDEMRRLMATAGVLHGSGRESEA